jgi:hypothetical protein
MGPESTASSGLVSQVALTQRIGLRIAFHLHGIRVHHIHVPSSPDLHSLGETFFLLTPAVTASGFDHVSRKQVEEIGSLSEILVIVLPFLYSLRYNARDSLTAGAVF